MGRILLQIVTSFLLGAVVIITSPSNVVLANEDIFLDEGDGDFDATPLTLEQVEGKEVPVSSQVPLGLEPSSRPDLADFDEETSDEDESAEKEIAPQAAPKKTVKKGHVTQPKKKSSEPKAKKRSRASVRGSFMVTATECKMMPKPSGEGSALLVVASDKKVWVEDVNPQWVRGYNRAGEPGYLNRSCFE